jgi:hypothetical protein
MNARGWYSGDLHNHRNLDDVSTLLLAEELNLAPTLADWVWEDSQRGQAPVTNEPIRSVDARHAYSVLDKEVERLMEGPGAVDLLGLQSAIRFEGYRLYPPNNVFTEAAHRQGGYVDAEKIVWRDVPVLVALGQIDFAGHRLQPFQSPGRRVRDRPLGDDPEVATRVHHGGRHAALGDGGLLPLPQLRLPAPGVGRERLGGQGRSPRIQPRLRAPRRAFQLRGLVPGAQGRPELRDERAAALPDR